MPCRVVVVCPVPRDGCHYSRIGRLATKGVGQQLIAQAVVGGANAMLMSREEIDAVLEPLPQVRDSSLC